MSCPNLDALPAARPRPRPQKIPAQPVDRESNALRASVLDAALQLGIADNSAVADWMFNNTLQEEDEDPSPTPDLSLSQESPLSTRHPLTPSSSQNHSTNPAIQHVHFPPPESVPFALSSESHTLIPHISNPADAPSRPSTPSKLKKKRSDVRDGCESEASGLRDAKRTKDKKDKKEKKDKFIKGAPFVPALPTFAESPVPSVTASDSIPDVKTPVKGAIYPPETWGYDTDAGRKSKKKKWGKKSIEEIDKEVKKPKGLFFGLGKKSSKGDLRIEVSPAPSPMPNAKPPVLPIAERFATTVNKSTGAPMISMGSTVPQTTISKSRLIGLGIDLDLDLNGEMFSGAPPPSRTMEALPRTIKEPTPIHSQNSTVNLMQQQQQPLYSNPTPPISYPPPPPTLVQRFSDSTSTSQSTGAGRISVATTVSTSHYNIPVAPVPSMPVLNRRISNSAITRPSTATSASSGSAVPSPLPSPPLPAGIPQTPSKRRVLPFFNGTPSRSSSSSGDSQAKDRERRREKEEKKREKERVREEREREKERLREEKERMKVKHKPIISLPLTRTGQDTPNMSPMPPLSANSVSSMPSSIQSSALSERQRTMRPTSPIMEPPHPVISSSQFQTQQNLLLRRASQTQTHTPGLSRQLSLTTLRSDAAFPIGHVTPIPMDRSPSPVSSQFPRPKRPRSFLGGRLSPLPAPPKVFVHHDIPPPSPPPMAPLPSVPSDGNVSPSLQPGNHGGNVSSASSDGGVSVNVGIAVTTGSPLPSPLLVTSPHYDSVAVDGNGSVGGKLAPPTSFNYASTAAGSTLRAKVRRRLSLTEGLFTSAPSSAANGDTASGGGANIPVINEPTLDRSESVRGRESPFPVAPVHRSPSPVNGNLGVSANYRVASPQSGWEDTSSSNSSLRAMQRHHVDRSRSSGGSDGGVHPQEEVDDDYMEGVREVISRFRESRIDDGPRKKRLEDNVIARRGSFEAFANANGGGNAQTASSGLTVPNGEGRRRSARYDSFAIEEYYGRSDDFPHGRNRYDDGEYADEGEDYYEEDASYYPDDEINRNSRKRRSTLYASDEDSSAHGHSNGGTNGGGGKGRNSRWSGSIYSRASFLDTEKSGEARQRFLRHVEEMLNERGERVPAVPPVPKLPEEFVAESRRAVSQKAREYDEFVLKKTVGTGTRKVFPAGSG